MKAKLAVFTVLTSILLSSSAAWAESPKEFVSAVLNKLQQQKQLAPLLEEVNWDSAFRSMPEQAREAFSVNSANELKTHFELMATDSRAFAQRLMEQWVNKMRKSGLSSEQQELAMKRMYDSIEPLAMQYQNVVNELSHAKFEVIKEETFADRGKVWVKFPFNGQSIEAPISVMQIEGRWKFTDVPILGINDRPKPS